ncbi:MAG: type 1 glutamine amidotransferase [Desulfobacteraceae bacterium]|nr:type 1 glutamine amidotransferase [Desulfobacteraceae bacterium]
MTWIALKRKGAKPVRITPKTNTEMLQLHGLVLGGGSDIDPENYGEELLIIKASVKKQSFKDKLLGAILFLIRMIFSVKTSQPEKDVDRDRMEKKLFLYAFKNQLPVLGICRGAQLINVALGGTLYQYTHTFYKETPNIRTILPGKKVYLTKKSKLRKIFNVDKCLVNSLHDQAVKKLGLDIFITAIENNKIVQAIEHTKHPFMIGVQWHPEYLPHVKLQQRLFKSLVEASKKFKQSSPII